MTRLPLPLLLLLILPSGPLAAQQVGIPYLEVPAEAAPVFFDTEIPVDHVDDLPVEADEDPADIMEQVPGLYQVIVPDRIEAESQEFIEIVPDRFSGGSRHGRTVYREMDHDDFDDEMMNEIAPAIDPELHPLEATVVPAGEYGGRYSVVVPVDRITLPQPKPEDRIFERLNSRPGDPEGGDQGPSRDRQFLVPDNGGER